MRVQLLFFAGLRDSTGHTQLDVELDSELTTVEGLQRWLPERFAALQGRMQSVRVAVNEEFVEPGHVLCEGDVIALIPPVSGG